MLKRNGNWAKRDQSDFEKGQMFIKSLGFLGILQMKQPAILIHCWQGISRSPAIALGILYMITGTEEEAARILLAIRPQAGPHQKIVRLFDEELGCNLTAVSNKIRNDKIERWKQELDLTEDSLLEELPVANDGPGQMKNEPKF